MIRVSLCIGLIAAGPLLTHAAAQDAPTPDRPDLVVADFEGDDYGGWTATGTAFGDGPAHGTLPGQMPVSGFQGRGLVNSFRGGDGPTGTLNSPEFTLDRKYLNFLIGGGGFAGETCIELLVGGEVVRSATGPNADAGGSERLEPQSWDVAEFAGKPARLRIVDRRSGGWGHINVDQIVQSDRKAALGPAAREIAVDRPFLHLPVKHGAAKRRMAFRVDGQIVREFEIELADAEPDAWFFADVTPFRGQALTIAVDRLPSSSTGLSRIELANEPVDPATLYAEPRRPQFHFTSRRGWLNDPNGLVYLDGVYHLFYQHNPYGREWGNMHWGHAISPDLLRWAEQPIALYPRKFGDWAFSGSAVVDRDNTSGFRDGPDPVLVLAYTSTGRGECIAYSNDRGRTWTEYDGNPVVKHAGRDPRLLWHEPTRRWIMAVYDEHMGGRYIAFYTSPDLKTWEYQSRIEGFFECPDLFELPLEGDPAKRMWVLYAADCQYMLGNFDGRVFHHEPGKHRLWHGNFYAAQTFSNAPDGRRIQIGWGQGTTFAGMPFNQQMTIPVELTLRPTADGPRMFAWPVRELESLRRTSHEFGPVKLGDDDWSTEGIAGDLLELDAEFQVGPAGGFDLQARGISLAYDGRSHTLTAPTSKGVVTPVDGRIRLKLLVDRGSIEVFANDGRATFSAAATPKDDAPAFAARSATEAELTRLNIHELKSAWNR